MLRPSGCTSRSAGGRTSCSSGTSWSSEPVTAPGLLEAFDQTIAAVRRLEAEGLRTAKGASAGRELERLLDELVARRAEVAAGGPFDREWAGRTVRWVAQ